MRWTYLRTSYWGLFFCPHIPAKSNLSPKQIFPPTNTSYLNEATLQHKISTCQTGLIALPPLLLSPWRTTPVRLSMWCQSNTFSHNMAILRRRCSSTLGHLLTSRLTHIKSPHPRTQRTATSLIRNGPTRKYDLRSNPTLYHHTPSLKIYHQTNLSHSQDQCRANQSIWAKKMSSTRTHACLSSPSLRRQSTCRRSSPASLS